MTEVRRISHEVSLVERDARLARGPEPDIGFSEAAYAWAAGRSLASVLEDSELTAGDFVRWVRQVSDFAGQIADAAGPGELREVARALVRAKATGVKRLHLMAGIANRSDAKAVEAFYKSVATAAEFFAPHGLDVVIEPINARNVPGYFLNDFLFARDLINELKIPNLKLQFDIYHCQIIHGDVTMRLREMMPITGHVQIASIPSRNEPDGEELNYPFVFAELDRLGYDGFVGCEYNPRGKTTDGLGWFKPYAGAKS